MLRLTAHALRRRAMSTATPPLSLQYDAHGPPRSVLRVVPAPTPPTTLPPGHVVVAWRLAAVNWSDVNTVEVTREEREGQGPRPFLPVRF